MSSRKLRVVILDFDGVVLESNSAKTQAFVDVFARFPEHSSAMMVFHEANVSASRFVKFAHLLERLGRAGDERLGADLAAEFSRRTLERMSAIPFVVGAELFLSEITPRVPVYLASVTPAEDLASILDRRGLHQWFRGVYGCPPWAKADAVCDILKREECLPEHAVLVGDSAGDQRAAAATGVHFVARDSGLPFDAPLPELFSDMTAVRNHLIDRLP